MAEEVNADSHRPLVEYLHVPEAYGELVPGAQGISGKSREYRMGVPFSASSKNSDAMAARMTHEGVDDLVLELVLVDIHLLDAGLLEVNRQLPDSLVVGRGDINGGPRFELQPQPANDPEDDLDIHEDPDLVPQPSARNRSPPQRRP